VSGTSQRAKGHVNRGSAEVVRYSGVSTGILKLRKSQLLLNIRDGQGRVQVLWAGP
jgi:hypothetical protein